MAGTERPNLFDDVHLEAEPRIPKRPLGAISNFVVDEFPNLLELASEGYLEINILSNIVNQKLLLLDNFDSSNGIARLDLLMLESGLVQLGNNPPDRLVGLVDNVSQRMRMLPALTFEDIVLTNPPDDIRTFTKGKIGRSEADFWIGHRRINEILDENTEDLTKILDNGTAFGFDDITTKIMATTSRFIEATEITHQIGFSMPKEHFTDSGFRRFVMTHPLRGLDGPSGAYIAGIPINEALIAGEKVPLHTRERIEKKLDYFPTNYQSQLTNMYKIADSGISLRQLLIDANTPRPTVDAYNKMVTGLKIFRQTHLKVVAHQLLNVLKGKEPGTNGEPNVAEFLTRLISIDLTIQT